MNFKSIDTNEVTLRDEVLLCPAADQNFRNARVAASP